MDTFSAISENPSLIDSLIAENSEHLTDVQRAQLEDWKYIFKSIFIIGGEDAVGNTIVTGPGGAFSVVGIEGSIADAAAPLLASAELLLIPFKNLITHCGAFTQFNIAYGDGMKTMMQDAISRHLVEVLADIKSSAAEQMASILLKHMIPMEKQTDEKVPDGSLKLKQLLEHLTVDELKEICKRMGIKKYSGLRKDKLIDLVYQESQKEEHLDQAIDAAYPVHLLLIRRALDNGGTFRLDSEFIDDAVNYFIDYPLLAVVWLDGCKLPFVSVPIELQNTLNKMLPDYDTLSEQIDIELGLVEPDDAVKKAFALLSFATDFTATTLSLISRRTTNASIVSLSIWIFWIWRHSWIITSPSETSSAHIRMTKTTTISLF